MMIAALDHLLRPAQKHPANGGFVLRAERGIDPIHRQREGFAVIANAIAVFGGEIGVAEGRVLARSVTGVVLSGGGPFGGLVHDVHQQGARPAGVVIAGGGVILHQREKGKQLGVALGGVFFIAHIAAVLVGHAAFVHLLLGAFSQQGQAIPVERIAFARPTAQPRQILRREPQTRMPPVRAALHRRQESGCRGRRRSPAQPGRLAPAHLHCRHTQPKAPATRMIQRSERPGV